MSDIPVAPAPERSWLEVDLAALTRNALAVAARVPHARLLPMVKADAYGLGAVPVARALERVDPWGFGVATVEEGAELRGAGILRPVLVFSPVTDALPVAARDGLTPVLGSAVQIDAWKTQAPGRPFHVMIDTGMCRSGLWWDAMVELAPSFAREPGLEGVCTHFHSAESDAATVQEQWTRFQAALDALGTRPPIVHAANSAATMRHPETGADMVRPGIFLYGGAVGAEAPEPVVTWRARPVSVEERPAGSTVGYQATWTAADDVTLATVAVGYADGFPRALANRGRMLQNGTPLDVVGGVSMDLTVVAAPAGARLSESDPVTLIGRSGQATITLDEMAAWAGTISYEILTGLGRRVPRVYV